MMKNTRRNFLKAAACAGITYGFGTGCQTYAPRAKGANERLRIAVVGVNGRGRSHISGFAKQKNVEIAYLVDPDSKALAKGMAHIKKLTGKGRLPRGVADIRTVLDDKTIDAVSIAAPNHWHSLMTIWGAQAGKHVYVEKPMSHDIYEGRIVVEAQKKYGIVVQHGTQRRSDAGQAGLAKAIKDGRWGRLKVSYGYACKPRSGIGFKPVTAPPSHLDWDLWRGPAELSEYHDNLVPYNWHWNWKTGNGDLNNQGTHQLDVAQWAIDDDQTHPVRCMAIGGRFKWGDQGETPNTMFGMAEYKNGQQVFFNVRNVNYKGYTRQVENEYYFEDGGKIIRNMYYAAGSTKGEKIEVEPGDITPGGNWGSFVKACRDAKPELANGNADVSHRSCVLGHLINNSYRLGKDVSAESALKCFDSNSMAREHFGRLHEIMDKGVGIGAEKYTLGPVLNFDPESEKFTGDWAEKANLLLKDSNRKGYEIPKAAFL